MLPGVSTFFAHLAFLASLRETVPFATVSLRRIRERREGNGRRGLATGGHY